MTETTTTTSSANKGLFIGSTIREAWRIFKEDWITVYAVNLLPFVIAILYTFLVSNMKEGSSSYWPLYFLYMVVQIIVGMGVINAFLAITRGKKVNIETFTSMLPRTFNYLAAQILMVLIILGGFLLLIVPGVIFSVKYMFTPYLVVDKGLGPIEALKASGKLTDGIKWDLVGFIATMAVLMYAGILALFVGLIVTIPVATVAYVVLYNTLIKRK